MLLRASAMLLLGGKALTERGLRAASRIGAATGARLLAETFPARMERGVGVPNVDRLAYLVEVAEAQLAGVRHLVLAGARSPVSFFAYPGQGGDLVPAAARSPSWPTPTRTSRPPWTCWPARSPRDTDRCWRRARRRPRSRGR